MKAYPVTVLCRVMEVSRSGFYDYLRRFDNNDTANDHEAPLKVRIKAIFQESRRSYGSRRILKKLQSEGHQMGRFKVRRLMRELALKPKSPRRYKVTTDSRHSFPVAANVLDRKFNVAGPNQVWASDITYVWTLEGWHYLAVVMDLFSRSDRGSQYACNEYQKRLCQYEMSVSMSRKGDCWDIAPVERFFRSLKSERLASCRFATRKSAKIEVLDYITYYNFARLHSTLGYQSPMQYEKEQYLKVA